LTKGKPWPIEDERKLKEWFTSGTTDLGVLASSFDGKYSENAIYQKLLDLGMIEKEEEETGKKCSSSSSFLELPDELPSVEEALKTLAAALKALDAPGLERSEVLRLRGIISGAKVYKELLADYINYRGIEAELLELRNKYETLAKKSRGT
jgi:hypothetical protein